MKKLTDKEIIELLQSNEEKKYNYAIKYLKLKYFEKTLALLKRKGADKETAKEIFLDGLMVIDKYARNKSFKEDTNIEALLTTICKNILYKKIERDKSINTVPFLDELNNLEDDGIIPESVLSNDLRKKLDAVTKQLGDKCKKIINLAFSRGFSNEDIKNELKYNSTDVVKQTKRRCLKKLRNISDEFGGKDFFNFK